jgi:nucleotide-binding universal stress UspA family protein
MYSKILVPVDGSGPSNAGLNEAAQLAKIHGSQMCLVHIVNESALDYTWGRGRYSDNSIEDMRQGGKAILDAAEKIAVAQHICPTRIMVETVGGVTAEIILEEAQKWHAELIVMGTHGRRGLARLAMGSDAEQVLRGAKIPVMLIREQVAPKTPSKPATAAIT